MSVMVRIPIIACLFLQALPASAQAPEEPAAIEAPEKEVKQDGEKESQDESAVQIYDTMEVRARGDDLIGIAGSASEGATGREDIQKRPILRSGEVVETVPGVIATQHSGNGKANQYFLRGFNLDHGTDFSVWVGGVPVNMPTHGHGQGYSDMNFLIPELVDSVRYRKGPYAAEAGDFSAAGGADIELVRELSDPLISVTGGSNAYGRILLGNSFRAGSNGRVTAAVDLLHADGPWQRGDDYRGGRGLVKYVNDDGGRGFSITAMGYGADWLSTDQVPRRAVQSGLIDRYGLISPGPRGESGRYSLSGEAYRGTAEKLDRIGWYLLRYDLSLISDFTYFLDDEDGGDQFKQEDKRWVTGFDVSRRGSVSWSTKRFDTVTGFQVRVDDIQNGLFRTRDLRPVETRRTDDVLLISGAPFAEATAQWTKWFRTRLGLRADYLYADVDSNLSANSDTVDDFLLSPKVSLIAGPWNRTELYLNLGYGFHSNDARGATIRIDPATGDPADRVSPLVRAKGVDLGFRTTAIDGLQTTVTLFRLDLDSELVFVGDGGSTEAKRPSSRTGIEWTNFYRVNDRLTLDLDVTKSDAEFTDDDPAGNHIPGAIEDTVAAGFSLEGFKNLFGGLRWRYFGQAPLIENDSVRSGSSSLLNGRIGYTLPNGAALVLDGFNLLDRQDSDIEYFYASRLPGEPSGGVEDIHFHPMEGRAFRLMLVWRQADR